MSEELKSIHVRLPRLLLKEIDHFAIEHVGNKNRAAAMQALLEYAIHAFKSGSVFKRG